MPSPIKSMERSTIGCFLVSSLSMRILLESLSTFGSPRWLCPEDPGSEGVSHRFQGTGAFQSANCFLNRSKMAFSFSLILDPGETLSSSAVGI